MAGWVPHVTVATIVAAAVGKPGRLICESIAKEDEKETISNQVYQSKIRNLIAALGSSFCAS